MTPPSTQRPPLQNVSLFHWPTFAGPDQSGVLCWDSAAGFKMSANSVCRRQSALCRPVSSWISFITARLFHMCHHCLRASSVSVQRRASVPAIRLLINLFPGNWNPLNPTMWSETLKFSTCHSKRTMPSLPHLKTTAMCPLNSNTRLIADSWKWKCTGTILCENTSASYCVMWRFSLDAVQVRLRSKSKASITGTRHPSIQRDSKDNNEALAELLV